MACISSRICESTDLGVSGATLRGWVKVLWRYELVSTEMMDDNVQERLMSAMLRS